MTFVTVGRRFHADSFAAGSVLRTARVAEAQAIAPAAVVAERRTEEDPAKVCHNLLGNKV